MNYGWMDKELEAQVLKAQGLRDDVSAIQPNPTAMRISQLLRSGREGLNYPGKLPEEVPLLGGMGLGDLVMGQSPEYVEDRAHGFSKSRGKGMTYQMDPRIIDVAALPLLPTLAAKGGMTLKDIISGAAVKPMSDIGRREFLKQAAALAGGAAVPDILKPLAKEVAPAVTAQIGKVGVESLFSTLAAKSVKWAERNAKEVYDVLGGDSSPESFIESAKGIANSPTFKLKFEELTNAYPKGSVDLDLVSKLHSQSTHFDFSRSVYFGEKPLFEVSEAEGLRSMQVGTHGKTIKAIRAMEDKLAKGNPKLVKQYEEMYVTGKLPKDASWLLEHISPEWLPENSKLGALYKEVMEEAYKADSKILLEDKFGLPRGAGN